MLKNAEKYANKIIENLSIGQTTIKELKQIIVNAWLAGYKAKSNKLTNDDNSSPASVQDSNEIPVDWEKIFEELKKINPDIEKYSPIRPWIEPNKPYTWPDRNTNPINPFLPVPPHNPYPWTPIIYC